MKTLLFIAFGIFISCVVISFVIVRERRISENNGTNSEENPDIEINTGKNYVVTNVLISSNYTGTIQGGTNFYMVKELTPDKSDYILFGNSNIVLGTGIRITNQNLTLSWNDSISPSGFVTKKITPKQFDTLIQIFSK